MIGFNVQKSLWTLFLASILAVATSDKPVICASSSPETTTTHELEEGVTMSQRISNEGIHITFAYEGQGWLGFGFSESGKMVGSTVVIGLPDEINQAGVNPQRFFLADKKKSEIQPLSQQQQQQQEEQQELLDNPTDGGSSSTTLSADALLPPVTSTPVAPTTPRPSRSPMTATPVAPTTARPSRAPVTRAPVVPTSSPTEWEWRRELRLAHQVPPGSRILTIEQAFIQQNETHTVLQFTRSLPNGAVPEEERAFNTFIYAVGADNELGYHEKRGSRRFFLTDCPTDSQDTTPGTTTMPNSDSWAYQRSTSYWVSCGVAVFLWLVSFIF